MIFQLNSFLMGPGTNFQISNVTGMGKASIRTSQIPYSGRDGGKVTQQFYGVRVITIEGFIKSPTQSQHRLDRMLLDQACPIGTDIPVYITLFDGTQLLINCRVTDFKTEYKVLGYNSAYKIELTAGDPLFYDQGAGAQTAVVTHALSGGYVMPYILPVVWGDGAAPTNVVNSGNAIVYPVITLNGAAVNPVLTNTKSGELVKLNLTMVGGDVAEIDMKNRTVKLNGANILANRNVTSSWWGLQPGNNPLLLNSDSSADPQTATVTWRSGYTGI